MKRLHLTLEDRLVVGSMLLTLAGIIIGAIAANPNAFGITVIVVFVLLLVAWAVTRSPRVGWLLVFGLVGGILELWADWLHVTHLHSLVYTSYFGFKLFESPSYMPLGWCVTIVQFGYLALRLSEFWPTPLTVAVLSLLGMSLPPWYEELAAPAQAWHYTTRGIMLSHTPLWIILTYGGCMFFISTLALWSYAPHAWGKAIVGGICTGAGIMFSAVFWFSLLGR
jgi:hypothetical protein